MRRALTLLVMVVSLTAQPAQAYLHLTSSTGSTQTPLKWNQARVRWFATDRGVAGVTAAQFQTTVAAGFATWEAVPTASVAFQFVGFTSAVPFDDDGISTFGFDAQPDLDRVLGATSFVVDTLTGEIVESDVFFNSIFTWSTAAAGDASRFDLQSVATHEIGHFIGLGHSALGETEMQANGSRRVLAASSVMFPIAFGRGNTADRELQPDDIAAVATLYPAGDFAQKTGSIQGRVRLGGRGVFAAHVEAFDLRTGDLVGGFSLNAQGEFLIGGLEPGLYAIRVEPLDDAATDSFFDDPGIDVNFRATLYDRLVAVPEGGAAGSFDVTVQSK